MSPAVVNTVVDVTPEWLTAVLVDAGIHAVVRAVAADRVGTGQMGSCYRVLIEYAEGEGPDRLIVKLPAADLASRAHAVLGYQCEVSFYREVAGRLSIRVPRCYFAALSDDGDRFTLVLEDLAPAVQGDQIAGCTIAQARSAAVNAAGLHGPTWCDPSLHDLGWVIPGGPETADFTAALLADATKAFCECYSLQDATVRVLTAFSERFVVWASGRLEPFSLVHSDYRLDNLMFAPPGAADPVATVDWQVVTVGLPLRDVAFLLATGLHPDDRLSAERQIVADYHRALVELGVEGYDAARCWEDYRYALFQAPLITMFGALVAQRSERGDRMFAVMAERSATAIVDLDALSLL